MANLFYGGLLAAGAWTLTSVGYHMKNQVDVPVENHSQNPAIKEPHVGAIGHIGKLFGCDVRRRFVTSEKTQDPLGATIFLVDYGNGQKVVQYNDPTILL